MLSLVAGAFLSASVSAEAATIFTAFEPDPFGAVPTAISDKRDEFLAAAGITGTDDLEGLAVDATETLVDVPLSFGTTGVTATASKMDIRNTARNSTFATSGTQFITNWTPSTGRQDVTFNFSTAINAFGFYYTDNGELRGLSTLTINGIAHTVLNGNGAGVNNGSLGFFGIILDPGESFTSALFVGPSTNELVGFDDLTIGITPVPVPAALTLLLTALGGLGLVSRRRKSGIAA